MDELRCFCVCLLLLFCVMMRVYTMHWVRYILTRALTVSAIHDEGFYGQARLHHRAREQMWCERRECHALLDKQWCDILSRAWQGQSMRC